MTIHMSDGSVYETEFDSLLDFNRDPDNKGVSLGVPDSVGGRSFWQRDLQNPELFNTDRPEPTSKPMRVEVAGDVVPLPIVPRPTARKPNWQQVKQGLKYDPKVEQILTPLNLFGPAFVNGK